MVDANIELGAGFNVNQTNASLDLAGEFISRQASSRDLGGAFFRGVDADLELLAEFIVRQPGSADLLGELIVRQSASADFLGGFIVRHSDLQELPCQFIVRHSDLEEFPAELIVRQSGFAELKGSSDINVRHSDLQELGARFDIRQCYPYWTDRRLINGVIAAAENLMGDANMETVIEGVMDDIKVWLDAECFEGTYGDWICIDLVPIAIKRATTYGVVSALYARYSKTFQGRVVPTVAPVTITVVGDEEKAMLHWMTKKRDMLELYLSAQGSARLWISTADEEPVFTMEDIPATGVDELESWHDWVEG